MENDLGRLVDSLPGLVWTALPDGRADFVNRRWSEYTGLGLDEAMGPGWLSAVHPEDLADLLGLWASLLEYGQPGEVEGRLRRHDGVYRWFNFSASPIADASGEIVKWCGINTDIETRKQAELALQLRDAHHGSVADVIPALITFMEPGGEVESVNRHVIEYFGAGLEDIRGWKSATFVHQDDLPAVDAAWARSLETGQPYDVEERLRRADGVYRWFHCHALPLRDSQGRIARWYCLQTDIDDRKRAEEALLVSERALKLIINTLPTTAWATDPAGYVEFLSDRWLDYAGFTAEQGAGLGWGQAIHPDDAPGLFGYWQSRLESGTPVDTEARMRRFDGAYRWFLFRANPLRDESGAIIKWFGANIDIEDRKRAEALLAGEKQLLAMVALGRPLSEVLEALCRVVEANAPGSLCSILSIDPDAARFRHGAGPSLPDAYNAVLDGLIIDPDYGPCGLAARTKTQAIAADVGADPRWQASPWPGVVLEHGLRSCWSTPILSGDDRVIGVFALYQREPAAPTSLEEDLIRQFAHVASIAIERAQSDTELRRTGAELRRLNGYLEEAQRLSLTGSFTWDVPTDEHIWSDETFRIFEIEPAQSVGLAQIQARVHPDDLEAVALVIGGAGEGLDFETELRLLMPSGAVKYAYVVGHRIAHITDRPVFLGCIRDITERKHFEENLRRTTAQLVGAEALSNTGSIDFDFSADEHYWSDGTYTIFEIDHETKVTTEIFFRRFLPEDVSVVSEFVAGAASKADLEFRLLMPDGRLKYIHIVAHVTRRTDGLPAGTASIQDITEQRLSEQALGDVRGQLAHMARVTALGALTASIAHEVNQPLSGIITNASTCLKMLAADPPNVAGAQETARRTVRDGNRAADVIKRLRALFARKGSAREPVDLNEAARELMALSLNDLQRRRVMVRPELADDLPSVIGDRVQLQQVILNLLLNAADAMDGVDGRPRQLTVTTRREDTGHVSVAVSDVGVGLDPGSADKLFEAFYTTKEDGMGIGLSVSRSIVESHGGRLSVQPNDGPGVTFTFTLPLNAGDEATGSGWQSSEQPTAANPQPLMVQR